jgi:hypothetical protein
MSLKGNTHKVPHLSFLEVRALPHTEHRRQRGSVSIEDASFQDGAMHTGCGGEMIYDLKVLYIVNG